MKPNEIYFHRNQGPWNWDAQFRVISWRALWRSSLSVANKLRVSSLILSQNIFGSFQIWTNVGVAGRAVIRHSTKLTKWGLLFYRSEKNVLLSDDGKGLRLEGVEYHWPLLFKAVAFEPTSGAVDESTTRASYQMPLLGTVCDCLAFLEAPQGHIDIKTPWLTAQFRLTQNSNAVLLARGSSSLADLQGKLDLKIDLAELRRDRES